MILAKQIEKTPPKAAMEELPNSKSPGAFLQPLPTQEAVPVCGLAKVGELGHNGAACGVPHGGRGARQKQPHP